MLGLVIVFALATITANGARAQVVCQLFVNVVIDPTETTCSTTLNYVDIVSSGASSVPLADRYIEIRENVPGLPLIYSGVQEVLLFDIPATLGEQEGPRGNIPWVYRAFNGTDLLCEGILTTFLLNSAACQRFEWQLPNNYEIATCDNTPNSVRAARRWSGFGTFFQEPSIDPVDPVTLRNTFVVGGSAQLVIFEWQLAVPLRQVAPFSTYSPDTRVATCSQSAVSDQPMWLVRQPSYRTYIDRTDNITDGNPPAGARSTSCDGSSNPAGYWQEVSAQATFERNLIWYYQNATERLRDTRLGVPLEFQVNSSAFGCEQVEPGNFAFGFEVVADTACRGVFSTSSLEARASILINGTGNFTELSPCAVEYDFEDNSYTFRCFQDNDDFINNPFILLVTLTVPPSLGGPSGVVMAGMQTFAFNTSCQFIGALPRPPYPDDDDSMSRGAVAGTAIGVTMGVVRCPLLALGCCYFGAKFAYLFSGGSVRAPVGASARSSLLYSKRY
jgi:hypothetical protein